MVLRVGKSCEASVVVDAPVDAVWSLVSDVTRTGEWSVECRGVEWLDGASGPVKGARFRGVATVVARPGGRVCVKCWMWTPRSVWRGGRCQLVSYQTRRDGSSS